MSISAIKAIDDVMAKFFGEFDNRDDRKPNFAELGRLFGDQAMIYKHDGKAAEPMCVDEFIQPRAALLTDGTLTDFYEWEIEPETVVDGCIASRICRFGKSGMLNGEPYRGEGRKHIQLLYTDSGWEIVSVIWQDDL